MDPVPAADESCRRLHRAGRSLDTCAAAGSGGRARWRVTGTVGENQPDAAAATQAGAWPDACRQAEARGVLRR